MPIPLSLTEPGLEQTLEDSTGSLIRRSILPGGIRLITERDPSVRSASVGFWLPVGSRDETPEHAGSTHVLEHLLFKGTPSRTALEIATAFDEVGGETNAATAKEHTCYYARVRSADLPMAISVLADMVTSPLLDEDAFLTEREVILEELAMAEDDPTDVGFEAVMADVLGPDTALGRPVGGTPETVMAVGLENVRDHYREHYAPERLLVTAVGDVDHVQVRELVLAAVSAGGWSLADGALPTPMRSTTAHRMPPEKRSMRELRRDTEQTHVFIGGPSITAVDDRRQAMTVLMSILGGGMSSRLFQEVRERRGLAYSVYSYHSAFRDAGMAGMYAACRAKSADAVADLLVAEVERMAEHGITDDELRRALGQITGSMALGLEDTQSRMARLATSELLQGQFRSVDEALDAFNAVERPQVQQLAAEMADAVGTRVDVGPERTPTQAIPTTTSEENQR
ncbi:insulinase family protein [Helcobacillus massiliensis]|uniref:Putative Zn-dependent peptidase n=1 Tax=Helcobacillus massiliensis TaxID=521392 RepID=A0A839R0D9_9MICO|nr:putative Zn-dependent peptidase [Helcobacillus massiliensis]